MARGIAIGLLIAISAPASSQLLFSSDIAFTATADTLIDDAHIGRIDPVTGDSDRAFDLGFDERHDIDAFDMLADGDLLLSFRSTTDIADAVDVVLWDGGFLGLAFKGRDSGVPDGVNLDAVALDGDDLLLSFDTTVELSGVTFDDEDLVRYDGTDFTLALDGDGAGVPDGLDIDGATRQGDLFLLSFDTAGVVGGVDFAHDDILSYDPGTQSWALWLSAPPSLQPIDIDALSLGPPPLFADGFEAGNTGQWTTTIGGS